MESLTLINPVDTWEEFAFIGFAIGSIAVSLVWGLTYKIKKGIKN